MLQGLAQWPLLEFGSLVGAFTLGPFLVHFAFFSILQNLLVFSETFVYFVYIFHFLVCVDESKPEK